MMLLDQTTFFYIPLLDRHCRLSRIPPAGHGRGMEQIQSNPCRVIYTIYI